MEKVSVELSGLLLERLERYVRLDAEQIRCGAALYGPEGGAASARWEAIDRELNALSGHFLRDVIGGLMIGGLIENAGLEFAGGAGLAAALRDRSAAYAEYRAYKAERDARAGSDESPDRASS